ncbi:hypothetical protein QBK99_19225 [Corticibacterium sp. UT-5YL-CI-8]|nr:hypothetical protein [Tianweitania sp. UT-5YL-CI-8]
MARHGSIAEQLQAVMAYRNRPEGEQQPIKTNWAVSPANDNNPEDVAGLTKERHREITPSLDAIMNSVKTGDVERNEAGQIIRIGSLLFSDGTQVEKAYRLMMGEVTQYAAIMPVGAMLGTSEKAKNEAGGSGDNAQEVAASNSHFASMFDVKLTARKPAGRNKRKGKSYTAAESQMMLDDAYANTDMRKVTATRYPAGLPRAGVRIADSFLGMRKAAKGESGSMAWEDITTSMVNRDVWATTVASLMEKDRTVLDAASTAKTMADIAPGGHRRSAERRGKARLIAANDNLVTALKKATA